MQQPSASPHEQCSALSRMGLTLRSQGRVSAMEVRKGFRSMTAATVSSLSSSIPAHKPKSLCHAESSVCGPAIDDDKQ